MTLKGFGHPKFGINVLKRYFSFIYILLILIKPLNSISHHSQWVLGGFGHPLAQWVFFFFFFFVLKKDILNFLLKINYMTLGNI
jgi:hypothetical protein